MSPLVETPNSRGPSAESCYLREPGYTEAFTATTRTSVYATGERLLKEPA